MNFGFIPATAGPIAAQQRHLIVIMVLIMLIVVVPMFIALFTIAWKYRAGNRRANIHDYQPEWKHGVWAELVLWAIPAAIVVALAVLGWNAAHALDPYKAIATPGAAKPLTVEVVALPWKWLFIYPQQDIATVNFLEFPVNTPVHFELTADGPISSFWIPQLGSQIYAMAAMETQLNLLADRTGEFTGKDTEINGAGYAGMQFVAKSVDAADFAAWVAGVQGASTASGSSTVATTMSTSTGVAYPSLTLDAYNEIIVPSQDNPAAYFSSVAPGLFDGVMMKYMVPMGSSTTTPEVPNATTSAPQAMPADMSGMQM